MIKEFKKKYLFVKVIIFISFISLFQSCTTEVKAPAPKFIADKAIIDYLNEGLNEAIIQDGFSPPVASRIYAYCNLAAYEGYNLNNTAKINTQNLLNEYQSLDYTNVGAVDTTMTMYIAFCETAYEMVYRDFIIDDLKDYGLNYFKANLKEEIYNNSMDLGKLIAENIVKYASHDFYDETRSYPLYTVINEPWAWVPTPPLYGTPIEPHWGLIRPFVINNVDSFVLAEPIPFDTAENSEFYLLNKFIYDLSFELTTDQEEVAMHWDGDPMPPYRRLNHVNLIKRQLNPVGHFLSIGKILSHILEQTESQAVENYLRISLASADAMIVCWDKKYEYSQIRPHTYINRYIDESWDPILATPLFPEYPSGHSCLAASATAIMIELFSDTIPFIDSSVIDFGLPPRTYNNLSEAANECAYSRIYGGIHYIPAIKEGLSLGETISEVHKEKIKNLNMQH